MEETVASSAAASQHRSSASAVGQRALYGSRSWRVGDWPAAWLLIAPVVILFGIAVVFPLIETIRLSFFDIKGLAKPKFVGVGNYVRLFTDPAFRNTLWTTVVFTVSTTVISVSLG